MMLTGFSVLCFGTILALLFGSADEHRPNVADRIGSAAMLSGSALMVAGVFVFVLESL